MKAIVGIALLMLTTAAHAQPERVFQVQTSIADAPCEAWVKQPDGAWSQAPNTVIVLAPVGARFAGTRIKGSGEAAVLDRKCGK